LGGPEAIRKVRAIELMQGNMPLPAVQLMLGHSTSNLTSSYVSFSEEEIRQVARLFMKKESLRKTSARNSFFGKINTECVVRISPTTEVCAVVASGGSSNLNLHEGDAIWVVFTSFSVILHVD